MSDDFKCQMCGTCCSGQGDVRLEESEIPRIACYLDISEDQFIQKYTAIASDRRGLTVCDREGTEGKCCVFLDDDKKCRINEVKPEQCRTFPHEWYYEGWEEECKSYQGNANEQPRRTDNTAADDQR